MPVELRVARLGVRSALIGALIGAVVAGGLSYVTQLRAETTASVTALQQSRQEAYADLIAATTSYREASLAYAVVVTVGGQDAAGLDGAAADHGPTLSAVTVAAARARLVGSDEIAGAVSEIETLSYTVSAELSEAYATNISGDSGAALDAHWSDFQTLSGELTAALDEFTALARDDIGTDRD